MINPIMTVALLFVIAVGMMASALLAHLAHYLSHRYRVLAYPGGRRQHHHAIAKLGVLPLYGGFFVAALVGRWINLPTNDIHENVRWWGVFCGGGVIALLAILDDLFELSPKKQLVLQIAGASIAVFCLIFIERFRNPWDKEEIILTEWLPFPFGLLVVFAVSIFWFMGMMNTLNWIDGSDGLATGVSLVACAMVLIHMLMQEQYSIALLPAGMIGTLLGFLSLNLHPARLFMGGGALSVGFSLACIGIIGGAKIALVMLVMAMPITDVFWQMVYRIRHGHSPARADRGHLHFRLADAGWNPHRIAWLYTLVSTAFGIIALLPQHPMSKLLLLYAFGLVVFTVLFTLSKTQPKP